MLTEERHQYILDAIARYHTVKLKDLISALNTSVSTVRRDLDELEKKGLLKRVHGGAVSTGLPFAYDYTIPERSKQQMAAKQKIGRLAASLIQDGDFIYLDSGTTTSEIIPFLKGMNITVVTNGLYNAERLIENNIPSYILAGKIKPLTKTIIGEAALVSLDQFRFSKAFIGANGISAHSAATTPDVSEAILKSHAIRRSVQSYLVADVSKFGSISFAKICDLADVTIITNVQKEALEEEIIQQTTILYAP